MDIPRKIRKISYNHEKFPHTSSIKKRKVKNITTQYDLKMLRATCDDAKNRYHGLRRTIKQLSDSIRAKLSEVDFSTVERVTESSRETRFVRERDRLKRKFERLSESRSTTTATKRHVKSAVLNLTEREIPDSHHEFVPALSKVPIMDIVTSIENVASGI